MGEAHGSDDPDVRLEWPDGSGDHAEPSAPLIDDDPGLPDGRIRVRVGDGRTVAQLREEVAVLHDQVETLRQEVASLRDQLDR